MTQGEMIQVLAFGALSILFIATFIVLISTLRKLDKARSLVAQMLDFMVRHDTRCTSHVELPPDGISGQHDAESK